MYIVDIAAVLNDEDDTGYVWTFLDEARDPTTIVTGAIVIAGDDDAAAVCQVVDMAGAGDGVIVYLRMLPGLSSNTSTSFSAKPDEGSRETVVQHRKPKAVVRNQPGQRTQAPESTEYAGNQHNQRRSENVDTVGVTGSIPVSPTTKAPESGVSSHFQNILGPFWGHVSVSCVG